MSCLKCEPQAQTMYDKFFDEIARSLFTESTDKGITIKVLEANKGLTVSQSQALIEALSKLNRNLKWMMPKFQVVQDATIKKSKAYDMMALTKLTDAAVLYRPFPLTDYYNPQTISSLWVRKNIRFT